MGFPGAGWTTMPAACTHGHIYIRNIHCTHKHHTIYMYIPCIRTIYINIFALYIYAIHPIHIYINSPSKLNYNCVYICVRKHLYRCLVCRIRHWYRAATSAVIIVEKGVSTVALQQSKYVRVTEQTHACMPTSSYSSLKGIQGCRGLGWSKTGASSCDHC